MKNNIFFTGPILILFAFPVILSVCLNLLLPKPPQDHGKGTMFDLIANRYDFINRSLALNMDLSWRKFMIERVTSNGLLYAPENGPTADEESVIHVLDLATGTADVAILMAKNYQNIEVIGKKRINILGIDPSQNMISVGNHKVMNENLTEHISLNIGDARNLNQLQDNYFHVATMSFGIRNVPEKAQCLCEIHRVLMKEEEGRKGAKLAILEFSEPRNAGVLGSVARLFIRYVVPAIGALLSGAPLEYMHLSASIQDFPTPSEFVKLIEGLRCGENGLGTYRVDELTHMNFGSVQLYIASPIWK